MMTDGIPDTKLMFKYVEVGRFDKTDEELTSLSDKWMYVLKNLSRLDNRPAALCEKIFSKLFAAASVARFTPTELREYEDSLKAYRDIKNSLDTAKEEGREEGREQRNIEIAKKNILTGDIDKSTLVLLELMDYQPKFDEDYLHGLIRKATPKGRGVNADE